MYKYKIFNLNVRSEIKLNAHLCNFSNENTDVTISCKEIKLGHKLDEDKFMYQYGMVESHFSIPETARFTVKDGNTIYVDLIGDLENSRIQLHLLGTAFGLIMVQKNIFPLHGSCINFEGTGIVVVGESGAGKSSLASGFVERGAKILTDDVSRLIVNGNEVFVTPSYPSQKIWANTAKNMNIDIENSNKVAVSLDKYYVTDISRFTEKNVLVKAIVEIVEDDVDVVVLEKVTGLNGISLLLNNSYMIKVINLCKKHNMFFTEYAKIGNRVDKYILKRPRGKFTVAEQVDNLILEIIENKKVV